MSLFAELSRRNVFKVGIAYLVVAWLVMQVADVVLNNVSAPAWVFTVIMLLLGIGFPFAVIFAWAFELTPEGLKREHEVDRTQSITKQTGRKLDFTIIGFLVLAVGYLLYDKFGVTPEPAEPLAEAAKQAVEEQVVEETTKSIAVLPFTNMSDDAGNEFFADGISEEILNALAKVKELKVAGRTSSFAFKGRNEDLRLIGETLGVNHILEGSVRKAGNKVRITAQLIQVEDGFHLWSEAYDRELTDIFAIQDEIAGAILAELKTELIGEERVASTRTDTEAYEKYLLAKQRIYTRGTPEMLNALELLTEVNSLDPEFAPAWAQLGIVTMLLSDTNYGDIPNERAQTDARIFLDRSLELDPGLAEGWSGLGLWYNNQVGSVEIDRLGLEALEKALAINPSMINAQNWLQNTLSDLSRPNDALAILQDMHERDPLYLPGINNLVLHYGFRGQLDTAEEVLERVRPFYAGRHDLDGIEALLLGWKGQPGKALALAERAHELNPGRQSQAITLSVALSNIYEFDRVLEVEMTEPWAKVDVLKYLGRPEEATILAREYARVDPRTYISILADTGEHRKLIEYFEEGWRSLDEFHADLGRDFGFGAWLTQDIAWAYQSTGNQPQFQLAMQIARTENDGQREHGANNAAFWLNEAEYWTLAGDYQQALDHLERSVDMGITATRITRWIPALKPLETEPRFTGIQARARANLERQRSFAGLEPLGEDYAL